MTTRIARQISRLNAIAQGPGAIRLPKEINGLHIAFRLKHSSYDKGAQAFTKGPLKQLQFHNPQIPMSVEKYETSERTPQVIIKLNDGTEKVLDVKKQSSEEILNQLIERAGGETISESEIPIIRTGEH